MAITLVIGLCIIALVVGFGLGVFSKFIFHKTMKDYLSDRIEYLNNATTSYTNKVQIHCNEMVEQAQQESLEVYKKALTETSNLLKQDKSSMN